MRMAWDFSTEPEFEEKLSCNASTLVIEEDLTLHMEADQWCHSQEAVARSRNPYGGLVQIRRSRFIRFSRHRSGDACQQREGGRDDAEGRQDPACGTAGSRTGPPGRQRLRSSRPDTASSPALGPLYLGIMTTFSAVVTTGIYCRPGCGAKPLAETG
jgi:hypothetical protein